MRSEGFLNINKSAGMTSHDVVARMRRLVGRGIKVGHAGTLDPAATGVLPLALGYATRLIEYLAEAHKGYRALIHLGITTTTDDAEGDVLTRHPIPALDTDCIEAALEPLRGAIMQVPPMYAALHHQGKRLYELARAGETVERAARPVFIDQLTLRDWGSQVSDWPGDGLPHKTSDTPAILIALDITCSKGTYIRSLARDLGAALGCGGHLAALERTFVGPFQLDQAITLTDLEAQASNWRSLLLPPELAVLDWPVIQLDAEQDRQIRHGIALNLGDESDVSGQHARGHTADGQLVALLRRHGTLWHPEKVFG